jgi:hypothetical protein
MISPADGHMIASNRHRRMKADDIPCTRSVRLERVQSAIPRFIAWLDRYGETSFDHQSYFAGPIGGRAKQLYYRNKTLGTFAVAPMIISEAFFPFARKLFWHKQRFPIADAHYAMGFAMLARQTGESIYYDRAVRFLKVLEETRCPGYRNYCWGYPFDWVTRTGVMAAGTPLITTTPYAYEAFSYVYQIDGNKRWLDVMQSASEHAATDIRDKVLSQHSATAGYSPDDKQFDVVNASAYRAYLLTSAGQKFSRDDYLRIAERNLNFVLKSQRRDGSWPYAMDGVRDFVDHFHTCFVLKALAKLERLSGREDVRRAINAGVNYYARDLFDAEGLPTPFSHAPRVTIYRRELYDYAECINLAVLLEGQSSALHERLGSTVSDLLKHWQKDDGSFRSRKLVFGWDNVPMHRWAQAQLFRSLCSLLGRMRGVPEFSAP